MLVNWPKYFSYEYLFIYISKSVNKIDSIKYNKKYIK
jgi:hypothetical protein